jgi:hypothetical protein
MLHQPHQTYLLLGGHEPERTHVRQARARRRTLWRRRLRGLLRTPAARIPIGVHHA